MGGLNYGIVNTINKFQMKLKGFIKEISNLFNNNWRIFGSIKGASEGIRSTSDYMGMCLAIMNALSLQSSLEKLMYLQKVQSIQ